MASVMALAPLVAPLIGGVLQTAFGWRSNFVVLFCFGASAWPPWSGCCCRRPCASARRAGVAAIDPALLSPLPRLTAASSRISASRHAAMPACSPGSPARRSCCRIFTACRRSTSALPFAVGSVGYLVGTAIAARLSMRLGHRPHDRVRRRWRWRRRAGMVGAWRWASTPAVSLVVMPIGLSHRHGPGAGAGQAGALMPFPRSRRRGVVAARLRQQDVVGADAARSSGILLGATAWPLAVAVAAGGTACRWLLWALDARAPESCGAFALSQLSIPPLSRRPAPSLPDRHRRGRRIAAADCARRQSPRTAAAARTRRAGRPPARPDARPS